MGVKHYRKVYIDSDNLPLLDASQSKELLIRYKNGDYGARQELIDGNLRLVLTCVQRYASEINTGEELFGFGCIGLIKAIDNFNLKYDVEFSTYAVPTIISEIRHYIRDNHTLKVDGPTKYMISNVFKAEDLFIQQYNKRPTTKDISKMLNIDESKVGRALNSAKRVLSIYEPFPNHRKRLFEGNYIMNMLSTSESDDECIDKTELKNALNTLDDKAKKILYLHFYLGKNQRDIAKEMGISQTQVSSREIKALKRLKLLLSMGTNKRPRKQKNLIKTPREQIGLIRGPRKQKKLIRIV